ncbi:ABC transporter permease [Actinokineospora sp. HUAS TT18]|uniref:ABC transporter permease n=1 Tax=Actinokineospora sp. HUAS TT18 TaxID=3447451 RepID=UPI003F5258F8
MLRYTLRRVPSAAIVLAVASILVFFVLRLAPGDPAVLVAGPDAGPETIAAVRGQLGLDDALAVQYWTWVSGLLTGDLGQSYVLNAPILDLIGAGFGGTLQLTLAATLIAVLLGGAAGIVLATTNRRLVRTAVDGVTSLAFAVPTYVSGVLLVLLFAVTLGVLPPGGRFDGGFWSAPDLALQYLVMPAFCLALPAAAVIARFLAASMRQVLDEDFVRTGVAKGLRPGRLTMRHVVPNAIPPVLTVLGIQIGQMLGGAIVVETIFAWPGIGQLLLQGVLNRDYLLVQDLLLLAVAVSVVCQLLTDLALAAADPRVRLDS